MRKRMHPKTTRRTWMIWGLTAWQGGARPARAQKGQSTPTAMLFGTVFQETYLALPGARVVAYDEARPKKKYRTTTNYRGEFRIRVPSGDATFVLEASAPGFSMARRTAKVYGFDKTTTNLVLDRRKRAKRQGTDAKRH